MTSQTCSACNQPLKTIYYQRRAADEPPDIVVYCENCPLNTSKLSIVFPLLDSKSLLSRDINKKVHNLSKRNKSYSSSKQVLFFETKNIIYIEGNAAQRCYSQLLSRNKKVSIITTNICIDTLETKKIINIHLTGLFIDQGLIEKSSKYIAPFISIRNIDIYKTNVSFETSQNKFMNGYEYLIDSIENCENVILQTTKDGKQPRLMLILKQNTLNRQYLDILQQVLIKYGTEKTIKSFIDSKTISTLYTHSARAYDWPTAPEEGYTFTWKPDGERYWYIKYGSVWLFCRRLLSGKIIGWNIANTLSSTIKAGPILDVEVMIGHPPILIDVLTLESGIPTRQLRSLDDVLNDFNNMTSIDIPIHIREYFKSEKELLKTQPSLQYPVDGTIGIENGSVTIIKLKSTKAIELLLKDNGDLVSAEDTLVATSNLQNTYQIGSIIELRFSRDSQGNINITETILRTDKTKANSYAVCEEIMKLLSSMPDTLARRRALVWCNSVRQKIHLIASKYTGKGRVILDIGAGDGQAISDYSDNPGITYILVEPDINKCKKLQRRLLEPGRGKCIYFDNAGYIHKAIASTSKGTSKYAIINSSIEEILEQEHCIKAFKMSLRYCVASFSISHVAESLQLLALEGLQVIGCGYFYDNIDNGKSMIDEYGVTMKKQSNNIAKVKWGNDTIYHEYPITSKDFEEFNIKSATSLVPIVKDTESSLLDTISTRVYVISTRDYF